MLYWMSEIAVQIVMATKEILHFGIWEVTISIVAPLEPLETMSWQSLLIEHVEMYMSLYIMYDTIYI